jgi:transcriptional regulator with XRE-family HTH domain
MNNYVWETSDEINMAVAENARSLRKRKGISQKELSWISGVSYGSVKRFETTGNISFLSLTKIAVALDAVDGIKALFTEVPYRSIEEVINEQR